MPITEGTVTIWSEVGVVQVFVGSVPSMNCEVSMFCGSV